MIDVQITEEQNAILQAAKSNGNLMLNALAGCGKTSTLEAIDKIAKEKPALYLVFNKRNADEAESPYALHYHRSHLQRLRPSHLARLNHRST